MGQTAQHIEHACKADLLDKSFYKRFKLFQVGHVCLVELHGLLVAILHGERRQESGGMLSGKGFKPTLEVA